jgi:SAM-dependent methyltransferase
MAGEIHGSAGRTAASEEPGKVLPNIYDSIQRYYDAKISSHGATPRGVDWDSITTQEVRFAQLVRICDFTNPLTLNDAGCGYGALASYLARYFTGSDIDYLGFDVSPAMIQHARHVRRQLARAIYLIGMESPRIADYGVASGLFNVKLGYPVEQWEYFVEQTLYNLCKTSRKGFAVNFLAPVRMDVSDRIHYRTTPERWVAFCERELQSSVDVLADYGLREFTLLVERD